MLKYLFFLILVTISLMAFVWHQINSFSIVSGGTWIISTVVGLIFGNKEYYLRVDNSDMEKLLTETSKNLNYTEHRINTIYIVTSRLAMQLKQLKTTLHSDVYLPFKEFIDKYEILSDKWDEIYERSYKAYKIERIYSEYAMMSLNKTANESDAHFTTRVKYSISTIQENYDEVQMRWKDLEKMLSVAFLLAKDLSSYVGTERLKYDDLIEASQHGWTFDQKVKRYGLAISLLFIPGASIGITAGVAAAGVGIGSQAVAQLYETYWENPGKREAYASIKKWFGHTDVILNIQTSYLREKLSLVETQNILFSKIQKKLDHLDSDTIYSGFIQDLTMVIMQSNQHCMIIEDESKWDTRSKKLL